MNKYKLHFQLIFSVVTLLGCFGAAAAQTASVTITPASIDSKVKPGASYTQEFTVTNGTGARLRLKSSVEDMWYNEQNVRLSGRAGTLPRSASLWIQLSPAEVVVEPRGSAVVKAVITVPQNASGSFYSVPVFEGMPDTKPAEEAATKNTTATASIGIRFRGLMMLTTTEGSEYNVEIMGGKITPPTASTELEMNLDLRNRGTAQAKVRGAFAILNASGALAGRGSIDEKRYLPTQRDRIKSRWSGELSPGNYTCLVTLSYNRVGLEPSSLVYEVPFVVK